MKPFPIKNGFGIKTSPKVNTLRFKVMIKTIGIDSYVRKKELNPTECT